ncbi:acetoacetyl-CoA reductase [Cupriavidus necator]
MTKRIALVTGGMSGIGEAISIKLHETGYSVIAAHSPNNQDAERWSIRMETLGRNFIPLPIDVGDYASCHRALNEVQGIVGAIDILVNNAGITRDVSFKNMGRPEWDIVMRTNLDSMFNVTKPVYEGMVERGWGRIINISSIIGSKGGMYQANYAAAKAGIHGFTKSLAQEVAKHGVTVNTISPGFIATRMVAKVPQDVLEKKILPQIPVGRLGQPAEVAGLVKYLCSNEAAFVTGANFAINGGQHMD